MCIDFFSSSHIKQTATFEEIPLSLFNPHINPFYLDKGVTEKGNPLKCCILVVNTQEMSTPKSTSHCG